MPVSPGAKGPYRGPLELDVARSTAVKESERASVYGGIIEDPSPSSNVRSPVISIDEHPLPWELYDPDGPTLAKDVYAHLLQGEEGEEMYKRAAAALRRAVVNLKAEEGIQTERWVNMIHIGA